MHPTIQDMKTLTFLIGAYIVATSSGAWADCYDAAAAYHRVNPWILRAIAAEESSFKPNAVGRNSNGSEDVGVTQTNSVHFEELRRYGIGRNDLFDACTSIYVAGWLLQKKVKRHGNTWTAVGAYHSETPEKRDSYARRIKRTIEAWTRAGYIRP